MTSHSCIACAAVGGEGEVAIERVWGIGILGGRRDGMVDLHREPNDGKSGFGGMSEVMYE